MSKVKAHTRNGKRVKAHTRKTVSLLNKSNKMLIGMKKANKESRESGLSLFERAQQAIKNR